MLSALIYSFYLSSTIIWGDYCKSTYSCVRWLASPGLYILAITCPGLSEGVNTVALTVDEIDGLSYLESYTYSCLEGYTTTDVLCTICQPDGTLSLATPPICNGEFYQINNVYLVYILCSVETLILCSTEPSGI